MKQIGDGSIWSRLIDALERFMAWFVVKWTLTVMPIAAAGVAGSLAILYLYIWFAWGLFWIVWFFIAIIGLSYLAQFFVNRPLLPIFQVYPALYRFVVSTDKFLSFFRKALGRVHSLQYQYAKLATKKFWALPLKTRIGISLTVLLILVPATIFVSVKTVDTVRSKWPYGATRWQMTPEDLKVRKENRINMALWAVWGKPNVIDAAQCMDKYKSLIYSEAAKNGLTGARLEAQLFVESFCKEDQVNTVSGAAGFAQIMLDVACEEEMISPKSFCKTRGKLKFIPQNKGIEDRRLDPNYAIPVAAKIIGKAAKYWGDENWGFVQYHMGVGNERKLVMDYLDETYPGWRNSFPANFSNTTDPDRSIPKAIAKFGFTYDDIFFRCSPKTSPKTYKRLYGMSDESATYVYTGLAALKGFDLMRRNFTEFNDMVSAQKDPDGGLANRPMRAWYRDDEAVYQNISFIKDAIAKGKLVPVPNNPKNGFVLRTSGASRIGECDPGNEANYYYTQKATLGMIYLIGAKTRELGADPFEITGLVRTLWMYDEKHCLPDTNPKTHVIGSAFDIGAMINGLPRSEKTKLALIFVIRDLRADGLIDRIDEGKADHIVYNPEFKEFFESVYDDVVAGNSPLVVQ